MLHVNRLPMCLDNECPCITGGSRMVKVWRDASNTPRHRVILPIELLAIQGATAFVTCVALVACVSYADGSLVVL